MTISKVRFASRELAESLDGSPDMAVISITDPGTPEAKLDPQFQDVLRLAFFDSVPADPFTPPLTGVFSYPQAKQLNQFVKNLHAAPHSVTVMVHCEFGVSRSAAVALFVEAVSGAKLEAREFTYEANTWVIDQLLSVEPTLHIEIPSAKHIRERREAKRA